MPTHAAQVVRHLSGRQTRAVAVVVYGNRAYDDALLELGDILTERGFKVLAAGAFIARHSIFSEVAPGRPDGNDKQRIQEFAGKTGEKLEKEASSIMAINIPGNRPYKERKPGMATPVTAASCISCRKCARNCPSEAIPLETPFPHNSRKMCSMHALRAHLPDESQEACLRITERTWPLCCPGLCRKERNPNFSCSCGNVQMFFMRLPGILKQLKALRVYFRWWYCISPHPATCFKL